MRIWIQLTFICVVLSIIAGYSYSEGASPANIGPLVEEALRNNPQIQAAYSDWKASEYRVREVASLPDPAASYSYFGQNVETRVGPQENKYGLSQKIPFPGKLSLKSKAEAKHSAMLKERYEAVRRELIKDIKFVYYDISWVDRAIRITQEEKSIIEGLEGAAQKKYESNLTPQQDVVKAEVELSKLIDKLFILRQQRKTLEARLNNLLSRPKGAPLEAISAVEPVEFEYGLDALHAMAKESRQELLAANLNVQKADYERSLAGLDYLPDFTLGFDYIQVGAGHTTAANDGQDAWMGTVAVNVPIWFDRLAAQVNEKKAAVNASKKNLESIQDEVAYEIEDIYFKIESYRDIVSLYKTALIPQTQQLFEAARKGYETGQVDFLNWLDSERALLQTRLAYYKAVVDYQKSIAYLERVIGRDL